MKMSRHGRTTMGHQEDGRAQPGKEEAVAEQAPPRDENEMSKQTAPEEETNRLRREKYRTI
jgi:hypothetical protein